MSNSDDGDDDGQGDWEGAGDDGNREQGTNADAMDVGGRWEKVGRKIEITEVLIATPIWKVGTAIIAGRRETVDERWQAQSFGAAKASGGLRGFPVRSHVLLDEKGRDPDIELWGLIVSHHQAAFAMSSAETPWEVVNPDAVTVRRVRVVEIMTVTTEELVDAVTYGFKRVGVTVTNVCITGTRDREATAQVLGTSEIPPCIFVYGHGAAVLKHEEARFYSWRERRIDREMRTAVVIPSGYGLESIQLETLQRDYSIEFMGTVTFTVPTTGQVVKGKNLIIRFGTLRGTETHMIKQCPRGANGRRDQLMPLRARAEHLIAGTLPGHLQARTKREILTAEALGQSCLPQNRIAYNMVAKMGVAVDVDRHFPPMGSSPSTPIPASTLHGRRVSSTARREQAAAMAAAGTSLATAEQSEVALRAEVHELRALLAERGQPTPSDQDTMARMVQNGIEAGLKYGLEVANREMARMRKVLSHIQQTLGMPTLPEATFSDAEENEGEPAESRVAHPSPRGTTPMEAIPAIMARASLKKRTSEDMTRDQSPPSIGGQGSPISAHVTDVKRAKVQSTTPGRPDPGGSAGLSRFAYSGTKKKETTGRSTREDGSSAAQPPK
ncbi:hypothetical protein HK101_003436 [Irineochytrium annulatum]|nr:hypothetical protein HK101_003436 [Irineochytrium annulatum]